MSRIDVMKILLRSAARAVSERARRLDLPATVRQALQDALARRVLLRDAQLTQAAGCAPRIAAITVCSKPEGLQIDASLVDGGELRAILVPLGAAFAPGGAKDISFRVLPAEAAEQRALMDVVCAITSLLARAVWGPFMPPDCGTSPWAAVECDGDVMRVDLRTVPAVRAAMGRSPMNMVVDMLSIGEIRAEPGALHLTLALPELLRR